jgi:probable HAF family extracellular repeat protein
MSVYNYTSLDVPGANAGTFAHDINNAGQIVGSYTIFMGGLSPFSQGYGFIYNPQDGTYAILNDPLGIFTSAQGINDVGQVVGNYSAVGLLHGFLYTGGTYTPLDAPGATQTQPNGINNVGQIVGSYSVGSVNHGFFYNGGTYTTVDDPLAGPAGTSAYGINNAGQIVGYYTDAGGRSHGFLYSGGTYTTIDNPTGTDTQALGINDLGEIVGVYSNGSVHGFLYSAGIYTTLDDPRATSDTYAYGINNSDAVVGYSVSSGRHGFVAVPGPNPPPSMGATANLILRDISTGAFEIYNIGNNSILAAYSLGQVGTEWGLPIYPTVPAPGFLLADFNGDGTSDMMLRSVLTAGFEIYYINSNNIVSTVSLGQIATPGQINPLAWQVAGFGNFNSDGTTDMMLREVNFSAQYQFAIYDIGQNKFASTDFGRVGFEWQLAGFGDFSGDDATDMILRNTATGGLQVYDISNNRIIGTAFMGAVGLDWQVAGFGNFGSNPDETDMIMRNTNTGGLELYDIRNNQITGAFFIGAVGTDWQVASFGEFRSKLGETDMIMRNTTTGALQVYDISNHQITTTASLGSVGLNWQVGEFTIDPGTTLSSTNQLGIVSGSTPQLVQAMAAFGGGSGAADGLNTGFVNADTSEQPFLTTPQHA